MLLLLVVVVVDIMKMCSNRRLSSHKRFVTHYLVHRMHFVMFANRDTSLKDDMLFDWINKQSSERRFKCVYISKRNKRCLLHEILFGLASLYST